MGVKGAILGDIIGSQYEFSRLRPADLDWKHCDLVTSKCRFTDDTVCTLAVKQAILENKANPDFVYWLRTLCQAYPYVGYGSMYRKWVFGAVPQPYGSFGNGSAMRVSAVPRLYKTKEEIVQYATQSAAVTHNHPEGVKGAIVTALAGAAKDKGDIRTIINEFYAMGNYPYPFSCSVADIRKIYRWDVTCQGSVIPALRCVYEADSWEEFMRNVMSLPCDMDTLGAIGGGVAEELFGLPDFADSVLKDKLTNDLYNILIKEE